MAWGSRNRSSDSPEALSSSYREERIGPKAEPLEPPLMRQRPRGARQLSGRPEPIDRIAACAPVGKLLVVEALRHARVPFSGQRVLNGGLFIAARASAALCRHLLHY